MSNNNVDLVHVNDLIKKLEAHRGRLIDKKVYEKYLQNPEIKSLITKLADPKTGEVDAFEVLTGLAKMYETEEQRLCRESWEKLEDEHQKNRHALRTAYFDFLHLYSKTDKGDALAKKIEYIIYDHEMEWTTKSLNHIFEELKKIS